MDNFRNQLKIKMNKIFAIVIIVVILLPIFNLNYGQVLGTHEYNTGSETITTLDAGEYITIPSEIQQSGGSWESEDVSWQEGTRQAEINKIWKEQGKKYTTDHWAYVETDSGEKRLLVALSSIYGETGSYVDIYVENDGEEVVYPCIMGDAKSAFDATTHWWPNASDPNRVTYGHQGGSNGYLNVVEVMSELPNGSEYNETMSGLCNKLKNVTKIVNGGLFTENREGPTGLEGGGYVEIIPGGSTITIGSQEDWLQCLEDFSNELLADGNWIYSNKDNKTNYQEARNDNPRRTNCALFVTHALQTFGVFESNMKFYGHKDGHIAYQNDESEKRMNQIAEIMDYNIGEMKTTTADLQPGDIVTYYGQHTNVYIGTNESGTKIWYDAGREQTTDSINEEGTFKTFTREDNDIGMNISHIIRLKYNTTISADGKETTSSVNDDESETVWGAIGSLIRNIWASICSFFENLIFEREDATVLYSFNEEEGSSTQNRGSDYVQWAIDFAEDDTHGYGWDSITGDWAVSTGKGKATNRRGLIGNPDVICSTFVWLALKENNWEVPDYPFEVGNMSSWLTKNGFTKVKFSENELRAGDIVTYIGSGGASNHTEIYIGDGKYVGARADTDNKAGDSNGDEVSIVNGPAVSYQYIWHMPSGTSGEFTQFYQDDYAHIAYGSSNIANCGCGPTSFAMVASTIAGTEITPEDAVKWCGNTYYVWGEGTSWSYFEAATRHFNLNCTLTTTNSIDQVVSALRSGALVISSQTAGLFTSGGHFIVLAGIDSSGGIIVKDPNKNNAINKGYNSRSFTPGEINASALNYWIFSF